MIKVLVDKKTDKYNYILSNNKDKTFKINIEFVDIEVNDGSIIYMDESLLNEKNTYTFGKVIHKDIKENDMIKIITKENEFILERYYG